MQVHMPLRCPSCGTIVGTGGGRCPTCGYLLPEDLPRKVVASSRPLPQPVKTPRSTLILFISSLVLAAVALAFVVRSRIDKPSVSSRPPIALSVAPSAENPARSAAPVDVSSFSARAAARAAAWHADALLVSIEALPVRSGKADVTGDGFVEIIYAKPMKLRLGPGSPLTERRLVVRLDRSGSGETQRSDTRPQKGIAEPNCPVEEVSRVVAASGVPADAPVRLRYAVSERHGRPVWRATSDDPSHARLIDGQSCAVLPK